jgi:hypothetical protein
MYRSTWGTIAALLLSQSSLYIPEPYMYVEFSSNSISEHKDQERFQKHQYDWLKSDIDWNSTAGKESWETAVRLFRDNRHNKQTLLSVTCVLDEPGYPAFYSAQATKKYIFAPSDPWLSAGAYLCVDGIRGDEPRTFQDCHHVVYPYNVNRAMQKVLPKTPSPHQVRLLLLTTQYGEYWGSDMKAGLRRMHNLLESHGYKDRFLQLSNVRLMISELLDKSRPASDLAELRLRVDALYKEFPGFQQSILKASVSYVEGVLQHDQAKFDDYFRQRIALNKQLALGDREDQQVSREAMVGFERTNYEIRKEFFGANSKPIDLDSL